MKIRLVSTALTGLLLGAGPAFTAEVAATPVSKTEAIVTPPSKAEVRVASTISEKTTLREKVKQILTSDKRLKDTNIQPVVSGDGIVLLRGN